MSSVQTVSGSPLTMEKAVAGVRGLQKHAQDLINQRADHKKWKRLRGLYNGNLEHGFDAEREPKKASGKHERSR